MKIRELLQELDDPGYPKYPDRADPAHREAAARGGKFGGFSTTVWLTDDEYTDIMKKAWEINRRLSDFCEWLAATFKVPRKAINIYGHFGWAHSHQRWQVKLQGEKWKRNDGFAFTLMRKSIPKKWEQFMPEFELKGLRLSPEFDPQDARTKTYSFNATWFPKNVKENKEFYSTCIISPTSMSEEEYVQHNLQTYSHNRLGSYIQALHDTNTQKYWADKENKK